MNGEAATARLVSRGKEGDAVHRSIVALSLCWLGPVPHETGKKVPIPGNDFARPRLALPLESPLGHVASFDNSDSALTVRASSAASQKEHSRVTTGYRGLVRHLFSAA